MNYPYLEEVTNRSRQQIVNFLGLNYSDQYTAGEFSETHNVTTDAFPCIVQRRARVKEGEYLSPTTLFSKAGLFVIDGTRVLHNGEVVGEVTEGRKQLAAVGNIVVIFPDKKYYDTEKKKFGEMETIYTSAGLVFGTNEQKTCEITTTEEDFPFSVGDAVEVTGCTVAPENNISIIVRGVEGKKLLFYENSFTAATETGAVTIKRAVPDLDYICESNYRLWGCKGDTIYASKYADPLNFNVFDMLTSDSYSIKVGSDGPFTGCQPFSSHICFFKEGVLHKLYGSKPANYQIVTANVHGVQLGCERSICVINETMYYMGRNGVYSYNGGVPELISAAFGTKRFSEACAETDGEKYYISMKGENGWGLYVYDIRRNLWLKEDDTHAYDMANVDGEVFFLDESGGLYCVNRENEPFDDKIAWDVTFCPFHETIHERKGYSKLGLRLELKQGSYLVVEIRKDSGRWEQVYCTHNDRTQTITIPIHPNRCDSFTVRLSGVGYCKIKSLVREFRVGSEV